jgi:hypothetical protein
MSRILWFAAGAGAGVYGLTKARRAAEALTPEGLADRLAGLSVGLHLFREEVRAGMDEKETELRDRLAVALHGDTSTARRELGRAVPEPVEGLDSTDRPMREGND